MAWGRMDVVKIGPVAGGAREAGLVRDEEWRPSVVSQPGGRGGVGGVVVGRARLQVVPSCGPDGVVLVVQSLVSPAQCFALEVGGRLGGVCSFTKVGRFGAAWWALACGWGDAPDGVRFESGTVRYRRHVDVVPRPVGGGWWAATDGVFATAAMVDGGGTSHQVRLGDRW
jgi:hypothetical protein